MSVGAFVLEGFGPTTDVGTFVLLGFGVGSTPTPTPTPTATLQGAGNPAGPGKPHTTANTYADIVRWTRRGTAVRVAAESVQTRRPWLHTYAEIRQTTSRAVAQAIPALPYRLPVRATAIVSRAVARTSAAMVGETRRASATTAVARQTERQDVADILAIIDLLEDLDDEG